MRTGTLLIPRDFGALWQRSDIERLARTLEQRLQQPVLCGFSENPAEALAENIQNFMDSECRRLVLLPLGLLPLPDHGRLRQTFERAKRQWPQLEIHRAAPVNWLEWSSWLQSTALDAARDRAIDPADAGVVIVGHGVSDPLINANLARLAHLLLESGPFASVSYGLIGAGRPTLADAIQTAAGGPARQVIVVPWLQTCGESLKVLDQEIQRAAQAVSLTVTVATPSLTHPSLLNVLMANHVAALPWSLDGDVLSAGDRSNSTSSPRTGITPEEAYELEELKRRIDALLPSEYQGRYEEVSPRSMGSAGLKYDSEGKVAWDEIWTSFCDLALAGGPPHRGSLLEAVTSEEALAEPEQYQAVVAEIERGIRLVTSLPVIASRIPGWIGVRCESEEMAVWLMRAIIVENIMVRREADVLYLPAGPKFTVKREIKNVITAVAKTVHYWKAHLLTRRSRTE